jgi:hypothetical protein
MALFLVLEDWAGNVTPTISAVKAGSIVDDAVVPVPSMLADGCPLVPYDPVTMSAALNAFNKMGGLSGPQSFSPDANLLALLIAAGALPFPQSFTALYDLLTAAAGAFATSLAAMTAVPGSAIVIPQAGTWLFIASAVIGSDTAATDGAAIQIHKNGAPIGAGLNVPTFLVNNVFSSSWCETSLDPAIVGDTYDVRLAAIPGGGVPQALCAGVRLTAFRVG